MFVSRKDINKRYERITKAEIIKYRMYIQGFKNFRDLLKKRNENGEDREKNYKLSDYEKVDVETYTSYMKKSNKKGVPQKAYKKICGYLLPSNLGQTVEPFAEQLELSKETQEKLIKNRKQNRERELEKYYKPGIDELEAILSWKNRREKDSDRQQGNNEGKKKTKPRKEEKEKDMRLAQRAREEVAETLDFERAEESAFYENQEIAEKSYFEEYLSKYSKDKLFKMNVYSFLHNAKDYDFYFCDYYMQVPDVIKDMLHKSLAVQLRENGLTAYADEWTKNCEIVLERIDSQNYTDYDVNVEEEWNRWGYRFTRSKEELEKLMPWVEQVSQLKKKDWECIKMYHQLCVNNEDIVNEIDYAIDWLARLTIDGDEKLF